MDNVEIWHRENYRKDTPANEQTRATERHGLFLNVQNSQVR